MKNVRVQINGRLYLLSFDEFMKKLQKWKIKDGVMRVIEFLKK